MPSRIVSSLLSGILGLCVSCGLPVWGQPAGGPDMQRGILNLKDALDRQDKLIQQDLQSLSKLELQTLYNIWEIVKQQPGDGTLLEEVDKAKKAVEVLVKSYNGTDEALNHREMEALADAVKAVNTVFQEFARSSPNPSVRLAAKGSNFAVKSGDLSVKIAELPLLYLRLQQDQKNRQALEKQYDRLVQIGQPYTQRQAQDALDRIFSSQDLHQQYLAWLRQLADQQKVAEQILRDGAQVGPFTLFPIGATMTIIDPEQQIWDLARVPGMNPDFINALKRQFELLQAGNIDAAMLVDKYPDGSYIAAFGSARGTTTSVNSLGQPVPAAKPVGTPPTITRDAPPSDDSSLRKALGDAFGSERRDEAARGRQRFLCVSACISACYQTTNPSRCANACPRSCR